MREKDVVKKSSKRREPEPVASDTPPQVDLASLLTSQSDDSLPEDILLNIHELRPKDTRVLSEKEFMKLKKELLQGFTSVQLEDYIKEYLDTRRLALEEFITEEPPWILERRPWVPAVENAGQDVEPQLDGYITADMTPKERLVTRLMRKCWDLSYQEVLDRDGYLVLRLRDVEFSLLTRMSSPDLARLP